MREFQKVVKDRIKMVLQVILRWKTTFLVKIFCFYRTKVFAKRMNCSCHIAHADDNTQVIWSQFSQSNKLIFLAWPDLLSALSKRDLVTKLSLAALFAVRLTQCLTEWLTKLVSL